MSPIRGTVENGNVRLVKKGILRDGQKVVVVPLPAAESLGGLSPEAEQEDVEFVRAAPGWGQRRMLDQE